MGGVTKQMSGLAKGRLPGGRDDSKFKSRSNC